MGWVLLPSCYWRAQWGGFALHPTRGKCQRSQPGASSASAAFPSLCTSDILPRSFANSLAGQRSARLAGSVVFPASKRHLAGEVAWKGDKAAAAGGTRAPAPGQRRPRRARLLRAVIQSKRGEPGRSRAPALLRRQVRIPEVLTAELPGRGSGEGHPGVERHAAPVGAAVPVELPAQRQVGCGERGREGGKRGVREAAGSASSRDGPAPALPGATAARAVPSRAAGVSR